MADAIITGASRGIGAALARALATRTKERLILTARDESRLKAVAGPDAVVVPGDLGTLASARALGARLVETVEPDATLIHNAGLWPAKRVLNDDGLESAFVVNHLAPLEMQRPLLEAGRLARVMVVSAGLIIKGQVDAERTPSGDDFSAFRTYCTTKLCFAVAMRDVARRHPDLDVVILHPGVVRTDLGARSGPLGWMLSAIKRRWESPERCAARLVDLYLEARWSPPGEARWMIEDRDAPWPEPVLDPRSVEAVRSCTDRLSGSSPA